MCTATLLSQASWDLSVYIPTQMEYEDSHDYGSIEGLLRVFGASKSTLESSRLDQNSFDPTEDPTILSIDDDEIQMDSPNSYYSILPESSVTPCVSYSNQETAVFQSREPSNSRSRKGSNNSISPPNSPSSLNYGNQRKFLMLDEATGRWRRPLLFEFMRLMLDAPECSHIAEYIDKKQGIFKIHEPEKVAELWKSVKGRNSNNVMTYDKFARALRQYYSSGIMHSSPGRFTFRFGYKSGFGREWWPAC